MPWTFNGRTVTSIDTGLGRCRPGSLGLRDPFKLALLSRLRASPHEARSLGSIAAATINPGGAQPKAVCVAELRAGGKADNQSHGLWDGLRLRHM
jgi:hypothetical protein